MEARPSRGTRGSWKRGGRGGNDNDGFSGEHRGRGRGGHHRGRSKRDYHRGRGRGAPGHAAEFHPPDQDEGDNIQGGDNGMAVYSRRKLETNWDRYEESERQEPEDDTPTQRGTDYHVLLESAGDSFTQFRFSEEKGWEMDSFTANQMSAVFVDLPALAQSLQQVPLHQRLNLEAELLQVLTPVELPTMTLAPKQEMPKTSTFISPSTTSKSFGTTQKVPVPPNPVSGSVSQASSNTADLPADDGDEELDQLLSLQKPDSSVLHDQSVGVTDENAIPEKACDEMKAVVQDQMETVKDKDVAHPNSPSVRQEITEEDLEDWLDSMIS
uniref:cell death regulator Aven n=1 Tax=Monopterus albus TaxID=43700 RepID=UPI0009B45768|nr:cell death regulator Aven [Monopterus albus]XP_020459540.1 cell death regulator Aven [Monopterus albus]